MWYITMLYYHLNRGIKIHSMNMFLSLYGFYVPYQNYINIMALPEVSTAMLWGGVLLPPQEEEGVGPLHPGSVWRGRS